MKFFKEFKEFAIKGNVVDMAVGIIIGAAFGTVVNSLVSDIITPAISGIFGKPDFSNLFVLLRRPEITEGIDMTSIAAIREAGGVALGYGLFINAVISFVIVAGALFLVIKMINKLKRTHEEKSAADQPKPQAPEDILLLREIRDSLKK